MKKILMVLALCAVTAAGLHAVNGVLVGHIQGKPVYQKANGTHCYGNNHAVPVGVMASMVPVVAPAPAAPAPVAVPAAGVPVVAPVPAVVGALAAAHARPTWYRAAYTAVCTGAQRATVGIERAVTASEPARNYLGNLWTYLRKHPYKSAAFAAVSAVIAKRGLRILGLAAFELPFDDAVFAVSVLAGATLMVANCYCGLTRRPDAQQAGKNAKNSAASAAQA